MYNDLSELYEQKNFRALKGQLREMQPADIADHINDVENEQSLVIFRLLDKDVATDVFSDIDNDTAEFIITAFSDRELKTLIDDLYVDDAVDLLEELPAGVVQRVLKNASPNTRELINRFLKYEPNSVGSLMTAEFAELKSTMTVTEAVASIRSTGLELETIYICYVTDASHTLLGVVSFKDMLYAGEDELISDIMNADVKYLLTSDDREDAAQQMSKYDFLAMPAVDNEKRLVGIVTIDDAIDVMREEATEDFQKMAAIVPTETPYLKTSVFALFKSRIVWLVILMLSGIVSGSILTSFEEAIAVMPLLVSFMPMITDTGGNAGSQSSTTVIRAMALGEITPHDTARALVKETSVALVAGIGLAAVNFVRIMLMYRSQPDLLGCAFVISLCVVITVVMSNVLGTVLPLAAQKLKLDPAIMAGPLITTVVDVLGLLVYFSIASALLIK